MDRDEVALTCARLLREGVVPRKDLAALDYPDTRAEIEHRLRQVGLMLATSAFSEFVGLRLGTEVASAPHFDSASNLGLNADACALLVILWARLVLQKRTAEERHEVPGQAALLPDDQREAARQFTPQVQVEAIVQEFGRVLGARSHIRTLIGKLRNLRFLGGQGETIEAGPLLELGVDGEQMISFIRRGVLSQLVEEKRATANEANVDNTGGVLSAMLQVLRDRSAPMNINELADGTGQRKEVLRELLQVQIKAGRIQKLGDRRSTRYQLSLDQSGGA